MSFFSSIFSKKLTQTAPRPVELPAAPLMQRKATRVSLGTLVLSAAAFVGIANHEAFRGTAYDDGVGVATVGFGTTEGVKMGDKITVEAALGRALRDMNKFEGALRDCVTVPVTQNEYDAFVSLAYNIGSGAFCKSTLVRKLNAGDYAGACAEISRWNKAGGKVMAGLTKRREAERAQCER